MKVIVVALACRMIATASFAAETTKSREQVKQQRACLVTCATNLWS